MRYPPFGRELAERLRWKNPPELGVIVCAGLDCWQRAKAWRSAPNDWHALVLPDDKPEVYHWPARDLLYLVEHDAGPSDALLQRFAELLVRNGSPSVAVRWADGRSEPAFYVPRQVAA